MSDRDVHLSEQTFALPVILTGHVEKRPEKNAFSHYYVSIGHSFFFILYFLLVTRLVSSRYYRAIFNILTGQKRDEFELRFVWSVNRSLVNTTGNSPKFILSLVRWNSEFSNHLGKSKLVGIYQEVWEIGGKISVWLAKRRWVCFKLSALLKTPVFEKFYCIFCLALLTWRSIAFLSVLSYWTTGFLLN